MFLYLSSATRWTLVVFGFLFQIDAILLLDISKNYVFRIVFISFYFVMTLSMWMAHCSTWGLGLRRCCLWAFFDCCPLNLSCCTCRGFWLYFSSIYGGLGPRLCFGMKFVCMYGWYSLFLGRWSGANTQPPPKLL